MQVEACFNTIIGHLRARPERFVHALEDEGFKTEDIRLFLAWLDTALQDLRQGFDDPKVLATTMRACGYGSSKDNEENDE